jgi:hypothetical protein
LITPQLTSVLSRSQNGFLKTGVILAALNENSKIGTDETCAEFDNKFPRQRPGAIEDRLTMPKVRATMQSD